MTYTGHFMDMRLLLLLLILIKCQRTQVSDVLKWTVIGKVTKYGQNVTLLCNVPNCCPQDAGWDRWTPKQRTLFIDLKTGRPNKKYDGKILKNGYTLIIQNLTKEDLNVSYSCLYGVTFGERKLLLEEEVFTHATQPHGSAGVTDGQIAALITGVMVLITVLIFIYCWKSKRRRNCNYKDTQDRYKYKSVPLTTREPVLNIADRKMDVDFGDDATIKCDLSDCPPNYQIYWEKRNNKEEKKAIQTIDTANDKYSGSTKKYPHLIITDIDQEDAAFYICCIRYYSSEKEVVFKSEQVKLCVVKEPVVCCNNQDLTVDFGRDITIRCKLFNCRKKYEIYWEKITGTEVIETLQTRVTAEDKYSGSEKDFPHLTIKNIDLDDAAFYRCCVKYFSLRKEFVFKSESVQLTVSNEPLVSFAIVEFKADFGKDATIECKILNCRGKYEIYWEKNSNVEEIQILQISDLQDKYSGSKKEFPHLTIRYVDPEDAAFYRCCIKYLSSRKEIVFKSEFVKLTVLNEPTVVCKCVDLKVDFGGEAIIKCEISNCPGIYDICWAKITGRNIKAIQTSDTANDKYKGSTKEYPHLIITNIDEEDAAFYLCCIKCCSYENEFVYKSRRVKLNVVNEPMIVCTEVELKVNVGDEALIQCKISNCPGKYDIYWEKITGKDEIKELQTNDIAENKYIGSTIEYPHLTITKITKEDDAFYRCCINYFSSEKKSVFKSQRVKLLVLKAKTELLAEKETTTSRQYEVIPKHIQDQHNIQIETWIKKDDKFVPTNASNYVIECLRHNSCITLTGCAGVGKSFIARHAALCLQKEGYQIIPVYIPTDMRSYYQHGKQTVFIVDDICGNFIANQQQIEIWKQLLPLVETIIKDKCCKIIVSCRLQVYKDDKFNLLKPFQT